jgi:hypothetical protein
MVATSPPAVAAAVTTTCCTSGGLYHICMVAGEAKGCPPAVIVMVHPAPRPGGTRNVARVCVAVPVYVHDDDTSFMTTHRLLAPLLSVTTGA